MVRWMSIKFMYLNAQYLQIVQNYNYTIHLINIKLYLLEVSHMKSMTTTLYVLERRKLHHTFLNNMKSPLEKRKEKKSLHKCVVNKKKRKEKRIE